MDEYASFTSKPTDKETKETMARWGFNYTLGSILGLEIGKIDDWLY